jgi:hypothetical protein
VTPNTYRMNGSMSRERRGEERRGEDKIRERREEKRREEKRREEKRREEKRREEKRREEKRRENIIKYEYNIPFIHTTYDKIKNVIKQHLPVPSLCYDLSTTNLDLSKLYTD